MTSVRVPNFVPTQRGFHFRNSDVVGARLGRQVAHFVFTHSLRD